MIYIGIDPGKNGGIACLHHLGTGRSAVPPATKMPETERDVWELVKHFCAGAGDKAIIEKVSSRPDQGVASMFKFGMSYGSLRMALIAAAIPFDEVTPQKWQRELGLIRTNKNESNTDKKNRHKAKAQQLFPELKVTHAIADALLIAEYCRRVNQ